MTDSVKYVSPYCELNLQADEEGICAVFPAKNGKAPEKTGNEALLRTEKWLDAYFSGERPEIRELPLSPRVSGYSRKILELLCDVPYGAVTTYGEFAERYRKITGKSTSARAVGRAVSKNPILIIIPCHRVIGADGSLTGYSGGLPLKKALLEHEKQTR